MKDVRVCETLSNKALEKKQNLNDQLLRFPINQSLEYLNVNPGCGVICPTYLMWLYKYPASFCLCYGYIFYFILCFDRIVKTFPNSNWFFLSCCTSQYLWILKPNWKVTHLIRLHFYDPKGDCTQFNSSHHKMGMWYDNSTIISTDVYSSIYSSSKIL